MNKLEYINDKAINNPQEFINECEKRYEEIISEITEKIVSTKNR